MELNVWKINMFIATVVVFILVFITAIMTRYSAVGVIIGAGFTMLFMLFMLGCNIMVRLDELEKAIIQTKM